MDQILRYLVKLSGTQAGYDIKHHLASEKHSNTLLFLLLLLLLAIISSL